MFFTAGWGFTPQPHNSDPAKGPVSVEITDDAHRALVIEMVAGKQVTADAAGNPVLQDPPTIPVDLVAYAANARYQVETGGIKVEGVRIATDERSQGLVTGAYTKAKEDPSKTFPWKGADGT